MCMTKHLSTLNSISHLASHLPRASRSCCRRLVSFLSVMSRYNTQSSAKSLTLLLVIDSCRSLMYARNKTGPRTVPCGTPLVTGLGVEVSPSSSTRWVLSSRKAVIQARLLLRTPYQSSLSIHLPYVAVLHLYFLGTQLSPKF